MEEAIESVGENVPDAPTEKQLAAIRNLAKATMSSVNLNKVTSKLIEELISKRNGGTVNGEAVRDKKCAYGLATKLIFSRYLAVGRNHVGSEQFWKDVDEFYRKYVQHMSRA